MRGLRMHIHFVNENVGGHATMHLHLLAALAGRIDVEATYFEVPPPRLGRRLLAGSVPGLGRLDLDLQPLRDQLTKSAVVRRHLRALPTRPDGLHLYTHNIGLLSVSQMRAIPTIVSLDATNRQNGYRLAQRRPTRFTPATIALTVPFERRVYAASRRIVTHSKYAADSVLTYGVPAARVEVIPFGITVPPISPKVASDALPRIVFAGASMDRKGGWRLLELWRRRLAGSSTLVLVTRDRVPDEPGVEVRNDISPGDGQLDEILAADSILAMPGEIDSFGYAALEAMAAGAAVVARRQGAMPEVVDDGVTGVLVPVGDDDAFGLALSGLVADRGKRVAMGMAGRQRLVDRFDARRTTGALLDLFAAVIDSA